MFFVHQPVYEIVALVHFHSQNDTGSPTIERVFLDKVFCLIFTKADSTLEGLQFLDIRVGLSNSGLFLSFVQKFWKPILPFNSYCSKYVKTDVITTLSNSTGSKYSSQLAFESCSLQLSRLIRADT